MSYYIMPIIVSLKDDRSFSEDGRTYAEYSKIDTKYKSYSEYNYLRPGVASVIKRRHFEKALELTKCYFNKANVIDFGCADGPFIPSLSKYFNEVVAVDKLPGFIEIAAKLCKKMRLNNVHLICNKDLEFDVLRNNLTDKKYDILFFLEGMEHVGNRERMYESKNNFLKELAALIDDNGIIVLSVPKMIGLSFFIQRIGLALLGLHREPISFIDFIKASFFYNTDTLEKKWNGEHLGFNHKKFEIHIKRDFNITKKIKMIFHVVYIINKKHLKDI